MFLIKFFYFFFLVLEIACIEQAPVQKAKVNQVVEASVDQINQPTTLNNSVVPPVDAPQDEALPIAEEAKIDGSLLQIFSPKVANLQEADGTYSSFVRYNTNGQTDYINYKICPLEDTGSVCPEGRSCANGGACVESITPELGFVLPGLYTGKVELLLSACVSSERSLSYQNCGEEVSVIYNSNRVNLEVATLLHQKAMYEDQATALILEHKAYLRDWSAQARNCLKQNADVEKHLATSVAFVEEFIKGPIEYFPKLLFTGEEVYENFTEPLGSWFNDFKEGAVQTCKELDPEDEYVRCSTTGMLLDMGAGILEGMVNPVAAVSFMVRAVDVVADPENSIPLVCNQEKKLATAHFQYESRKTVLVNNYNRVKTSLEALGISVK